MAAKTSRPGPVNPSERAAAARARIRLGSSPPTERFSLDASTRRETTCGVEFGEGFEKLHIRLRRIIEDTGE